MHPGGWVRGPASSVPLRRALRPAPTAAWLVLTGDPGRATELASRVGRSLVVAVSRLGTGDRLLPSVRGGRAAGARCRLRKLVACSSRLSGPGWTSTGATCHRTWWRSVRERPKGGRSPNLYCQAMHELDLPRRYRTIFVCGGLGLGSTREQDQQALRRLYEHLKPGGRLVLDNEVPYSNATQWGRGPPDGEAACRSRRYRPVPGDSDPTVTSMRCRRGCSASTHSASRRPGRSTPNNGAKGRWSPRSATSSPRTCTSAASS